MLSRQKPTDTRTIKQRKDVKAIANLTVGACSGCMMAVFSSMLIGRWGYVISSLTSLNDCLCCSYLYRLCFATLVYCFIVGAAKALPQSN